MSGAPINTVEGAIDNLLQRMSVVENQCLYLHQIIQVNDETLQHNTLVTKTHLAAINERLKAVELSEKQCAERLQSFETNGGVRLQAVEASVKLLNE